MKSLFFLILSVLVLSACSDSEKKPDEMIKNVAITNIIETPNIKDESLQNKDIYDSFQVFVNIELLDDVFSAEQMNMDIIKKTPGVSYHFHSINEEGHLYFYRSTDSVFSEEVAYIGFYDIFIKEITIIKEAVDAFTQFSIHFVNEDYILWAESYDGSDWYKYRLCLYDKNTGEEIIYFEPEIVYTRFMNPPCVFNDNIYFEYMYSVDNDWIYVDLFEFNISTGTLKVFDTQSKKPTLYQEGVSYLKQSDDNKLVLINFFNNDSVIRTFMDLPDLNALYFSIYDDVFAFTYPLYEEDSDYEGMIGSGAAYLTKSGEAVKVLEPIETGFYINTFDFYGNIGVFNFTEKTYPFYYNISNNTLYIVKDTEKQHYQVIANNSFILYIFVNESRYEYIMRNFN